MGSKKRSVLAKQRLDFLGQTNSLDDIFSRESLRREELEDKREEARIERTCTSKQRYATREEAIATIGMCEAYGTRGLTYYRCEYCKGWHLTSHPRA